MKLVEGQAEKGTRYIFVSHSRSGLSCNKTHATRLATLTLHFVEETWWRQSSIRDGEMQEESPLSVDLIGNGAQLCNPDVAANATNVANSAQRQKRTAKFDTARNPYSFFARPVICGMDK